MATFYADISAFISDIGTDNNWSTSGYNVPGLPGKTDRQPAVPGDMSTVLEAQNGAPQVIKFSGAATGQVTQITVWMYCNSFDAPGNTNITVQVSPDNVTYTPTVLIHPTNTGGSLNQGVNGFFGLQWMSVTFAVTWTAEQANSCYVSIAESDATDVDFYEIYVEITTTLCKSSFTRGGYSGVSGHSGYSGINNGVSGFSGKSGFSGTGVSGYSGVGGGSGFSGAIVNVGMSTYGATSGSTGLANKGIVFVGTNGIGISQSTNVNGSRTVFIQRAPYISNWMPVRGIASTTGGNITDAAFHIWPVPAGQCYTASRANLFYSMAFTTSNNTSYSGSLSQSLGIYTRNGSTLSLASSGSQTFVWSDSSGAFQSALSGIRQFSLPINVNMTPGEYWFGYWVRSSGGAIGASGSFIPDTCVLNPASPAAPTMFLSSTHTSYNYAPGLGRFSNGVTFSTAMPSAIQFSQIAATRLALPYLELQNQ